MFRSSSSLGFPRRIVAYYLFFSMIAVSWLAVGVFFVAHSILASRATKACLSSLGRTAAALEIDYLRNGPENLQQAVERIHHSEGLLACSIVSPDGTFLAHSNKQLVGQPAPPAKGRMLRWGHVTESRQLDERNRTVSQFEVPLVADDEDFGTLRVSAGQLSAWGTLVEVARVAPLAVLVPLSIVVCGAYVLARLSKPMASVDGQLRAIARQRIAAEPQLQPLKANNAVAIGWNRVVDLLDQRQPSAGGNGLDDRLAQAIEARRQNGLQDVLHNLSDGIAVTDVEGRITFANRAIAALLGGETSDEDLAGVELANRLLQGLPDTSETPLLDVQSQQRPIVAEVNRPCGSRERVLRVGRQPIAGDRPRGHVWSVRDVTQQKLATKMRDQFIDAATHELRTPLANIKAYSETLATCQTIDVDQQKEFCNIINSEVTRLARFVDDLLSISSMESGSLTIERQKTDSARMFAEVISKVEPLMKQKEIEFEVHLPEKMQELQLDKDKIVAVLVNLLGNAAKYTPSGGRVSLRVKLDADQLQVAVEDTGMGIAADELPKVFEKFFRSADPRVQSETGTGLGLALAREVVRMHGGDITAESQLDQGSTFTAAIPVK